MTVSQLYEVLRKLPHDMEIRVIDGLGLAAMEVQDLCIVESDAGNMLVIDPNVQNEDGITIAEYLSHA